MAVGFGTPGTVAIVWTARFETVDFENVRFAIVSFVIEDFVIEDFVIASFVKDCQMQCSEIANCGRRRGLENLETGDLVVDDSGTEDFRTAKIVNLEGSVIEGYEIPCDVCLSNGPTVSF
jgi:hypothetical protein